VTSRLPIEHSFPLGRTPDPAAVRSTTVPAAWFPSCQAVGPCTATPTATPTAWSATSRDRRRLGSWLAHLGSLAAARAGRRRRPRRCGLPHPCPCPSKAGRQAEVIHDPGGVLPWAASQPPPVGVCCAHEDIGWVLRPLASRGVAVHGVEVQPRRVRPSGWWVLNQRWPSGLGLSVVGRPQRGTSRSRRSPRQGLARQRPRGRWPRCRPRRR
jgi:hypothetical protein